MERYVREGILTLMLLAATIVNLMIHSPYIWVLAVFTAMSTAAFILEIYIHKMRQK